MDLTTEAAGRTGTTGVRGSPVAMALLAGSVLTLIGLTWDVQWHSDVGPDTFFTLPHLFLYAGSAVAGLASLGAVLAATAARRAGREVDPAVGGTPIRVFGPLFTAPVGHLVAGCGAASFLIYGLWDQWWHGLYGFDAVIDSPPHIGLLLSVMTTMVGTVMVFAAARGARWGRWGVYGGLAVLLAFSSVTVLGLVAIDAPFEPVHAAMAFLATMLVMAASGFGGRGAAVGTALALAAIQAATWWFSPRAARVYADAVGLPVRDYARSIPDMPALMPMALPLAAVVVELVVARAARWSAPVTGAVAGALLAGLHPVQDAIVYGVPAPGVAELLPNALAGAVLGALAGVLGLRFGRMLRLVGEGKR